MSGEGRGALTRKLLPLLSIPFTSVIESSIIASGLKKNKGKFGLRNEIVLKESAERAL